MPPLHQSTAVSAIARSVSTGEVPAVELAEQALAMAKGEGRLLNAFITLCEEKALEQARVVDDAILSGMGLVDDAPALPLAGVPVVVKDNICYTDYQTTCGSHILEGWVSPYDATVVTRLEAAGAVIIGKTNLDEFGMGSSNETSAFGPVKNPHDLTRVPGGSSGGSAAAVAQGIVPLALGSDTGGSVRQPAAFCGVVGLKPTYGAVSRYGLVAFVSSCDQIGPLARTVDDAALLYAVLAGHDPRDSTSSNREHPNCPAAADSDRRLTIGVPGEYLAEGLDGEIRETVSRAIEAFRACGHRVVDVSLPLTDKAIAAYYVIAAAEASTNLARYDGVRFGHRATSVEAIEELYGRTRGEGFGPEVKRRIMLGTYALSAGYHDRHYVKASKVRELVREEYRHVFDSVDLLIAPTTPTPPFHIGEKIDDPLAMYLSDVYTCPANLAGIPALSVPFGETGDNLPIGVQLIGRWFDEVTLIQAGRLLERRRAES